MSTLARIRNAEVPWLAHFLTLSAGHCMFHGVEARNFLLTYFFLAFLWDAEAILAALQDPSEPPIIPFRGLPFLGHTLCMFWYGASYFAIANRHYNYPIYTLQTLNARTVVVISPHLAAPIQRASKNLSFYKMILEVTRRLVDFDDASMQIIKYNLDDELGTGEGIMEESHDMVASILSPGPTLNQLSTTQLEKFALELNALVPPPAPRAQDAGLRISLMDFVKRVFTVANAYTIYGPQNPFAMHPSTVQDFWDYEAGMVGVMADICPWLTARKPWKARQAVNAALREFVEKEHYKTASPMIQKRVAINLKHGLSTKMAGHAELILLFGILGNAVPTTFWFLANVFSSPSLLQRIRDETSVAISSSPDASTKVISVAELKNRAPLLTSTYRETLRTIANLSSVRLVTSTHTITTQTHAPVLLKKGTMIQIASGVIHGLPSIWGPDAHSFNPERFLSSSSPPPPSQPSTGEPPTAEKKTATATPLPRHVPSAAYRAFGGGSVICPGRHFAQSEILGFVALCVHMFDIVDAASGAAIARPERDNQRIPLSVMKPVREPEVWIRRREGVEGVRWGLEL